MGVNIIEGYLAVIHIDVNTIEGNLALNHMDRILLKKH